MPAGAHEETIRFRSGSGELEGCLGVPDGAANGAVVCHPHPAYGGDMNNDVVVAVADALRAAGMATLRFNFRGVGASGGSFDGGRGECDDARAALAALGARVRGGVPALVGYSFGALIALAVADGTTRLVAVAPPLALADSPVAAAAATLVVAGDRDSFCPLAALNTATARWPRTRVVVVEGADHFFAGHTARVGAEAAAFLAA